MKTILLIFLLFLPAIHFFGQELDCVVNVTAPRLEGTDKRVFETMQTAIYEFMNNRKWTNYNIKIEERIECTVLLTINERPGTDEFRGSMNLVLRRPIYNTAYNSILLNLVDKEFNFRYVEYQPLDYSDGVFSSNLTSTLAFYTYLFLGCYFDSFSQYAGTPFFEKAQEIVNTAQSTQESGWKAFEGDKNRFWLVENILNPSNVALRDFSYNYHRLGLDMMYERVDLGRNSVTSSLEFLKNIYEAKPGLYLFQITLDAKRDEFVNIYADQRVPPMEKTKVVNLLKEIDPANASKYQRILQGK